MDSATVSSSAASALANQFPGPMSATVDTVSEEEGVGSGEK